MILRTCVILTLVVAVYLAGSLAFTGHMTDDGAIKIGVIGSLTGNLATQGASQINAIELAAEEINSKGGINGHPIELIIEDTSNEPRMAVTAAQKLINVDQVVCLMSDSSTMTLTISPIAEQSKIPVMGYMSSSPEVTNAGDFTFRTSPSNIEGMKQLATIAFNRFEYIEIGIISELIDYPQGIKKVFTEEFELLGGQITADEKFEPNSNDVRLEVLKIKNSNPDAVLILTQSPGSGAIVLKQMKEMSLDKPILSNDGVANTETISLVGDAAEGIVFVEPSFDTSKGKAKKFFEAFNEKYDIEPPVWVYAAAAYDAMNIIAETISEVGTDGEKIKEHLYTIKDRESVIGNLSFDKNGDPEIPFSVRTIKNSEIVTLDI